MTTQTNKQLGQTMKILFSTFHLNTETSKILPKQSTLQLPNTAKLTGPQERTA